MVPSRATYRATSGRQRPLRFSKSGAKPIEDAYSRHYKWNKSAEKKPNPVDKNRAPGRISPGALQEPLTGERRLSVLSAPAGCCKPARRPEC
jgi:hypothetical protein